MTDGQIPSDDDTELNALGTRTDIVSDVAHEMRNPLNALLAYTELLKTERHGRHSHPKYKQYSDIAHDAAEALVRICDRLLLGEEAGSDDAGVETDARAVAERMIARYSAMAEQKKITLDMRFDREFPKVPVPDAILEDVLGNLVVNAIKFTPAGGTVAVIGKRDPATGAVIMVIRDTGIGMPAEKLSEVLKFLPVKPVEGLQGEMGTGRGLSIVKKQLAPFGVTVEIRSNPNFGTSVSLVFPPPKA
ncbi:MAG: HAMP domain-containing histidine kinase [Nisaea sp.]|jgi:signal transduction histidine kinase|uniref:sensor histidine kinase n=1 Tax=Nisaea sp. TaxID=2024842 RepID=UPI001B060342|nr:HAMP domain-containing sensor histidine kinase [Nisaea sp.]MBO6561399.1 HAMP domain-containing histidine kinase [Nisaea sp.]